MRSLRTFVLRIAGMFNSRSADEEFQAELESHLEMHIDDGIRAGLTRVEARRQAIIKLGGIAATRELQRERRGLPLLESSLQDIRYGLRILRRNPGFTAFAVLSLGLGIGANSAIFSLIDRVLLRNLPVENPQQIYLVQRVRGREEQTVNANSLFTAWRDNNQTLTAMAASGQLIWKTNLPGPVNRGGRYVSGNYFQFLGLTPALGRLLNPLDDKQETDGPAVVLDYQFWQTAFHGDMAIIGKPLRVNRMSLTIVGVAPAEFFGTDIGQRSEIYVPLHLVARVSNEKDRLKDTPTFTMAWLHVFARPKPGIPMQSVTLDLDRILKAYNLERSGGAQQAEGPESAMVSSFARGFSDIREKFSQSLFFLMCAVGMVLLMASVNVANLLLERATARRKEIAMRLALGASRGRICRQLLTEGLLLGIAGGIAGLLIALWANQGLVKALGAEYSVVGLAMELNWRTLAFTSFLSLIATLVFALAPALQSVRTATAARPRLGKGLVVLQAALSLLLVAGATLFIASLRNLQKVDPGFNSEQVLQVALNPGWDSEVKLLRAYYKRLLPSLQSIPGVKSVGLSNHGFMQNASFRLGGVRTKSYTPTGDDAIAEAVSVAGDYFKAAGIKLHSGRTFDERDKENSLKVAMINQTMARRFWGTGNPIGSTFSMGSKTDFETFEVVGVVRDTKYGSLNEKTPNMIIFPYAQLDMLPLHSIVIRSEGTVAQIEQAVRQIVQSADPAKFLNVESLKSIVDQTLVRQRLMAAVSAGFGFIALLLAATGIYGVVSYTVTRRTSEIGVRMALGAMPADVRWMMLRESMLLAGLGVLVGVPAGIVLSRYVENLLYGINPLDPWVLATTSVGLLLVAALAGWIPANRAAKVEPLTALRCE